MRSIRKGKFYFLAICKIPKSFFCVPFLFILLLLVFRFSLYGCLLAPQYCGNPDLIACHVVIHSSLIIRNKTGRITNKNQPDDEFKMLKIICISGKPLWYSIL